MVELLMGFPSMSSYYIGTRRAGNEEQLLTPQPFGRGGTFDDVSSGEIVLHPFHGHVRGESQTLDLLTPQPFGRDGTFDDVPTDEIVFYQRH